MSERTVRCPICGKEYVTNQCRPEHYCQKGERWVRMEDVKE